MPTCIGRFEQFGLPDGLLRRIAESGHGKPSQVQEICIPPLLEGRNLYANAEIGTGKTLAFVLPMLARLKLERRQPQVLVLTASDEAAVHVAEVFHDYARYLPDFHVLPIYHQTSAIQLRQLSRGVHVIVGAPRRVLFHVDNDDLGLGGVASVVIDEADRILLGGYASDIETILRCPTAEPQIAVFGTTQTQDLLNLVHHHVPSPLMLDIGDRPVAAPAVRQYFWQVPPQSKLGALTRLLDVEPSFDAALVFVHNNAGTHELAAKLNARGYAAAALDCDTSADEVHAINRRLRSSEIDVVVTTDLAATVLAPRRISHVVSYDAPRDAPSYAQRLAHFDDANPCKTAVLLVLPREMPLLHSLEHATQAAITAMPLPERFR